MPQARNNYCTSHTSTPHITQDRLERFLLVGSALQEFLEDVADALLIIH
ncbi:hypothetical protein [Aristophania vespae]|nr:hypothetical protein [Aristophania vespae]UMM63126.1 hypothetical protein DM15PD_00800 [Aristophania vespae]